MKSLARHLVAQGQLAVNPTAGLSAPKAEKRLPSFLTMKEIDLLFEAQADVYGDLTEACVETPACRGITVWGIDDGHTWLDHMDHIVGLVGWQHAAIGTDWPMPLPKSVLSKAHARFVAESGWRVKAAGVFTQNMAGFDDYPDFPNLTTG